MNNDDQSAPTSRSVKISPRSWKLLRKLQTDLAASEGQNFSYGEIISWSLELYIHYLRYNRYIEAETYYDKQDRMTQENLKRESEVLKRRHHFFEEMKREHPKKDTSHQENQDDTVDKKAKPTDDAY